jgi:hypothetical protein
MKYFYLIIAVLLMQFTPCIAQQFESDVWLAEMRMKEGYIYFGAAKNITNTVGYDNQPFFLNDTTILYTHMGEDKQADIFQYRIKRNTNEKFTNTTESEYSAKLLPSKAGISVVEVEKDSTQRIWSYDLQGKNGKVLVPQIDSVGYYTWINDTSFAAFILTEPSSLQLCYTNSPKTKVIANNIGRCMQVNTFGNLYFTMLENDSVRWLCRTESDGTLTKLIEFYKGVEDFVISKDNIIFCAKQGLIYFANSNYKFGWRMCGNFESVGVNNINRIALSPDNKKLAFVNIVEEKK